MKKWIRWQGLIPFVIIVALITSFGIFFLDSTIKWSIEEAGTRAVGAKVELGSANFDFSGPSVSLHSLKVTNPDKPMQNIVDIDKIAFSLDGGNLLLRKVIIDDMTVDNVKLNTPRKKSGALKQPKSSGGGQGKANGSKSGEKEDSGFSMPAFATPDLDEIMGREKLKTPELADKFETDVDKTEQEWRKLSDKLPSQERLDSHKKRFDAIKKTNTKDLKALALGLKDLGKLKKDIDNDIKSYKNARNTVSSDIKQLRTQLKELKNSPKEEYKRLLDKYSLDESGMGNISHLLFGNQAKEYTALALEWYKKFEPYINDLKKKDKEEPEQQRQKGVDVKFREDNPTPSFLIKTLRATVNIPAGKFKGQVLDITADQNITGKPTTLKFVGDKLKNNMSIKLTGNFNHINKKKPVDTLFYSMKNYKVDNHKLVNDSDLKIILKDARSDVVIKANRKNDKIAANGNMHVHSIKYDNSTSGGNAARLFMNAINQTKDFNVTGKLNGTFEDYSTSVKSDLDDRIKGNLKKAVSKEKEKYKKELKKRVEDAARKPIEKAEKKLNDMKKAYEDELNARKKKYEDQLAVLNKQSNKYKNASSAVKNKAKKKAKKKAEDKLKNKLKGLFGK